MPEAAPLEPGDPRSLGQYEVVGRLGAGGQGAVYLGKDSNGGYVAVKLLHAQFAADPSARARFVREVSAAQKVAPFCTSRVIEADVQGDQPYIVSEFIDGPSLHDVVAQNGPRGAAELERLAIGTVTALAAIHEAGIVHRDFKPNNVLLAADGPRVVDFGIARTVNSQESAVTATGMVVGTPGYLAPEQLTGAPLMPTVDIFAWGATMVFAATGQSPFEADTLPVIINRILHDDPDLSALPEPLRGAVRQCLVKDPAERPTAPQLLLQLLGHVGAAPSNPAPAAEELLGEGTRIAAQLAPPPAVTPAWQQPSQPTPTPPPPTPPPLTPPPMPMPHQQRQAPPPPGPPTPPPMQMYQGPPTPPPMQMYQGPPTPPPMHMQQGPAMQPPVHMQQPQMGPMGPMYGAPPAQRKSSNGPLIAVLGCAGAALLAVILVLVIVAIASNSEDDPPYTRPTYSFSYRPPSFTATPFSNYGAHPSFAGTWTGRGYQTQPEVSTWDIELTLTANQAIGRVKYDNGRCTGLVTVRSSDATRTEARELVSGTNCEVTGYLTLRLIGSSLMRYEWKKYDSDSSPAATGTLSKQ